jgi:hypothetical protein
MGSLLGGVKAGTLSGGLYFGGAAAFNAFLLFAFKADVLNSISQSYPQNCPPVHSIDGCFSSVVSSLPYIAFLGFLVSLFFVGLFGRFYESVPGGSPLVRGEVTAVLVGFALVLLGLTGARLGALTTDGLAIFYAVWTVLYGAVLGRLYRSYTRSVRFETTDKNLVRVVIDGNDYTGKSRTFARSSVHRIRAKVAKGTSFREWDVSGGVTVEDSRALETTIEVNGDGLLRAQGGKKH